MIISSYCVLFAFATFAFAACVAESITVERIDDVEENACGFTSPWQLLMPERKRKPP